MKEFLSAIGLTKILENTFRTTDMAKYRIHNDIDNLLQSLYQIFAGYFEDDRANDLRNEPVMTACLEKDALASQPTMSRFFNRMDAHTLEQFNDILKQLRKTLYEMEGRPRTVLFDLDTTLLNAYVKQEGFVWNFHYGEEGYHPKLCYNGLTGDLIRAELRDGTDYCSKDIASFMEPVFHEFTVDYPFTNLFVRGDSRYAAPELYMACEKHGAQYAIRLKANQVLYKKAGALDQQLYEQTSRFTFIVTNMTTSPEFIVNFYCGRGQMKNFIKECKNDFDFSAVSSSSKVVNANRFQVHVLAYNLINMMHRLVFPDSLKRLRMETIRIKLIKIASRVIRHGRKIIFRLCSSNPYKQEFTQIMQNILNLSSV